MDTILVVNAGSSSVKFQVFGVEDGASLERLIKGQMDGIGTRPRLRAEGSRQGAAGRPVLRAEQVKDVPAALESAGTWLRETQKLDPIAVGHRVVHGGPRYDRPVVIDDEVLAISSATRRWRRCISRTTSHRSMRSTHRTPDLLQVACFDTAFHRGHSALADHYAIPQHFYAEGVRRYGFHGLSYEYIASRLPQAAPQLATGRVIVAHLGSGASMCALSGGRSVESTMGFTALDGLAMGTRPGQLDPGVVLYLIEQKKMTAAQVQTLLYNECGLKGLSGISNDVRELEASTDPRASFALDFFAYRVGLQAGQLAAALGGVDGFVFTAGIGENSPSMRARIAERLAWLGAELDPAANARNAALISRPQSRISLHVMPTDEELMIAQHTLALLSEGAQPRRKAQAT